VAQDLLFARNLETGQIFFVCAACGAAGNKADTCDRHIRDAVPDLAPSGWSLATRGEVEAAGLGEMVAGPASEDYAEIISWYPGFTPHPRCNDAGSK
jgi:hypothetical protein